MLGYQNQKQMTQYQRHSQNQNVYLVTARFQNDKNNRQYSYLYLSIGNDPLSYGGDAPTVGDLGVVNTGQEGYKFVVITKIQPASAMMENPPFKKYGWIILILPFIELSGSEYESSVFDGFDPDAASEPAPAPIDPEKEIDKYF